MKTFSFPLLQSAKAGFTYLISAECASVRRLLLFPLLLGFGTLMALEYFDLVNQPLLMVAARVPDDIVRGVLLALLVRQMVLGQAPLMAAATPEGKDALRVSALLFAAINFIYTSMMAMMASTVIVDMPAADAPPALSPEQALLSLGAIIFVLWSFRFQWLPIAAAAGFGIADFSNTLWRAGFVLSLRVFFLHFLLSVPSFVVLSMAAQALQMGDAEAPLTGASLWVLLIINTGVSLFTIMWQTAASVCAMRFCMKGSLT